MRDKSQKHTVEYNYDKIRNQVAQNIAEGVQQDVVAKPCKQLALWKRITLVATYTLLVCAVACGCTLGVQRAYASTKVVYVDGDGVSDSIYYCPEPVWKSTNYIEKFDRYVSFGRMTATELMRSYLLSEADKDVINHAVEHYKQELGADFTGGVFLGEIDGEDYIYIDIDYPISGFIVDSDDAKRNEAIGRIRKCEQCNSIFPNFYKCDLEYTLNDIVSAFEKMIGESLSDEFLCDIPRFCTFGSSKMAGGIHLEFIENDDWCEYTYAFAKELDKYQHEKETLLYTEEGDYSHATVIKDDEGFFEISLVGHDSIYANEIISIGKDGLVYTWEYSRISQYCEIYYALYNNQLYVINRSYMLTGDMMYCPDYLR